MQRELQLDYAVVAFLSGAAKTFSMIYAVSFSFKLYSEVSYTRHEQDKSASQMCFPCLGLLCSSVHCFTSVDMYRVVLPSWGQKVIQTTRKKLNLSRDRIEYEFLLDYLVRSLMCFSRLRKKTSLIYLLYYSNWISWIVSHCLTSVHRLLCCCGSASLLQMIHFFRESSVTTVPRVCDARKDSALHNRCTSVFHTLIYVWWPDTTSVWIQFFSYYLK